MQVETNLRHVKLEVVVVNTMAGLHQVLDIVIENNVNKQLHAICALLEEESSPTSKKQLRKNDLQVQKIEKRHYKPQNFTAKMIKEFNYSGKDTSSHTATSF